jgi:hypothetical protein
MKTILRLLFGLSLAACVASARAELSPVSFVVGKQQFKSGDSIVIDQVAATSPKLDVGAKVVVRGHYRLASVGKAKLGLFVTHRTPVGEEKVGREQLKQVESPGGAFELSCEISAAGDIHVSFYPASGEASFGGVYFSGS